MARKPAELTVLFVCTGNICRSPLAEQLFQELTKGQNFTTNSAGVYAEVGIDMHPQSQKAMQLIKYSPKPHASKQLTQQITKQADLIITSTQDHSNSTAQIDPSASKKTFTLKELSRISKFLEENQDLPKVEKPKEKIDLAIRYRGYAPRTTVSEDIIDPWGRSFETYIEVTDQTHENLKQIVNWLGGKC